ncbi:unnamed protein product [Urochloa humidicola]
MTMSLRRLVYLVTDDTKCRQYLLCRVDMSGFFFPKHERGRLLSDPHPPPVEEARLPAPAIKFVPPLSNKLGQGRMHFMHVPGGDGVLVPDDRIVAADQIGRNLLYNSESDTVCTLCNLTTPKLLPISVTVGSNLYILDAVLNGNRDNCFEGIMQEDNNVDDFLRSISTIREDWCRESLPPPPYAHTHDNCMNNDPAHVTSYTVVGNSNIWISKVGLGTHSFDTASRVWTKVGDWALPFYGRVHYVPKHKLWFGLSCGYGEDAYMCASDLTVMPPTAFSIWGEPAKAEWTHKWQYLVHLGRSRFCHARFYQISRPYMDRLKFVEFTGLEVQRCEEDGNGSFMVVQHRSKRYSLDNGMMQWVL